MLAEVDVRLRRVEGEPAKAEPVRERHVILAHDSVKLPAPTCRHCRHFIDADELRAKRALQPFMAAVIVIRQRRSREAHHDTKRRDR